MGEIEKNKIIRQALGNRMIQILESENKQIDMEIKAYKEEYGASWMEHYSKKIFELSRLSSIRNSRKKAR